MHFSLCIWTGRLCVCACVYPCPFVRDTACAYVSYGIGYSTEDRGCGFHVMSYGLDTAGLCDNLGKALQEMKEVMVAYAPAPKPAKQ